MDSAYAIPVSTIVDAQGIVFDGIRNATFFVTSAGQIYRADANGAAKIADPNPAEGPCDAGLLAQDETSLYWTCSELGVVKRMTKP